MLPGESTLWARDLRLDFVGYMEVQLLLLTVCQFLGRKDPLEKGMATHSNILAWESHRQWSLAGYSPQDRKCRTPPQLRVKLYAMFLCPYYLFYFILTMLCLSLSPVRLSATPQTVAHQAPLSVEFSSLEYWSG